MNPNGTAGTAAHEYWFQKPPFSWFSKLEASCESQTIILGSTYLTTNMGLSYTLTSLSTTDHNNKTTMLPGTPYTNNTMENCVVGTINIYPERRDYSLISSNSWTWGKTYAAVSDPRIGDQELNQCIITYKLRRMYLAAYLAPLHRSLLAFRFSIWKIPASFKTS